MEFMVVYLFKPGKEGIIELYQCFGLEKVHLVNELVTCHHKAINLALGLWRDRRCRSVPDVEFCVGHAEPLVDEDFAVVHVDVVWNAAL